MTASTIVPVPRLALLACLIAPVLVGCGSSTATSGVAIGKVGRGLSTSAQTVPQGAEVCVLQDALAAPAPGPAEKPPGETCAKAIKSDQIWRRAMVVLGAHADRLGTLGSGAKPENTGQLESALTGVRGEWGEPNDAQEQAARDAVTQLANQMGASDSKTDLTKAVKDAAPQVKTLCEGLAQYLDKQVQALVEIETEVEKRRTGHKGTRCGKVGEQALCVSESYLDRVSYANVYTRAAAGADNHAQAKDTLAGFCAVHQKLADAAAKGNVDKDETTRDVVATVKSLTPTQPPSTQPPFAVKPGAGAPTNPAAPLPKGSGAATPEKK